jgi:hypothetical protein
VVIEELLNDARRRRFAGTPETDPLREEGALDEAQLLEFRLDAVRSVAWLLFDCRGALQIRAGNTAILAAHAVTICSWRAAPRTRYTAWTVVGSEPRMVRDGWSLSLAFVPDGRLELEAQAAEVFVGDVPGCDEAPPDYGVADDETLRSRLAGWHSEFTPAYGVFFEHGEREGRGG